MYIKNILLFPGAFNPPHYGHIEAIKIALEKVSFDELWIMPSGKRDDKTITINYGDRRALGNFFVEYLQSVINIPVKLITTELDNTTGKLTHEILKEVKSQNDVKITQLIGIDSFLSIQDKLDDNEEKFIIINRQGYEIPIDFSPNENIIIFEGTNLSISSTQIRAMVKNNDVNYKKLVPEKIALYIEDYGLYLKYKSY